MQRVRFSSRRWLLYLVFVLPFGSGCYGPRDTPPPVPKGPKGSATGKVSYEGKPITAGTIMLDSGKGDIVAAPIKSDGTFELKGSHGAEFPAGEYKVSVQPPEVTPDPKAKEMAKPPEIPGVPSKFYNPGTSGVTVVIKEGKQNLDIVLK
jgi:hypothetical protein